MIEKLKKKCPLCFSPININGKCSCGYDDKISGVSKISDKQKVFIIIAVISIIMFIATAYNFTTSSGNGNIFGAYRSTFGEPTYHTNWIGMSSLAIGIGSFLGAILFKNK